MKVWEEAAWVRAYSASPSVPQGGTLDVFAAAGRTCDATIEVVRPLHGDTSPSGPGHVEQEVNWFEPVHAELHPEKAHVGSYGVCTTGDSSVRDGAFTADVYALPRLCHHARRQTILSAWDSVTDSGWRIVSEGADLILMRGAEPAGIDVVRLADALTEGDWYAIRATCSPTAGRMTLSCRTAITATNSRVGRPGALGPELRSEDAPLRARPIDASNSTTIGIGATVRWTGARPEGTDLFDGKIERPTIYKDALSQDASHPYTTDVEADEAGPYVCWDFAQDIDTSTLLDISGSGLHGQLVNRPERAVPGILWSGETDSHLDRPEEYGAIAFHSDDVEDCLWPLAGQIPVPHGTASGCYAVKVTADSAPDAPYYVPFVVPPGDDSTRELLLVLPTLTYLAYANWQVVPAVPSRQAAAGSAAVLTDVHVNLNEAAGLHGLSLYDTHIDGTSVKYASWRRPLSNMQPSYRHREFGGTWGFSADLYLIYWLETLGYSFDVVSDHDLDAAGLNLLNRYRCVMTGTHPEYSTAGMLDAYENYILSGGNVMYLGGNGFYWVTSIDEERPWTMEVRKGHAGTSRVRIEPGEVRHSTSGEIGGLWRHRGHSPQKVFGTGFAGFGMDTCSGYLFLPDSDAAELDWMMEGLRGQHELQTPGLLGEGPAGYELDRYDRRLGTPPQAYLAASSFGHSNNYMLVQEETGAPRPNMRGAGHPDIRADLVTFTTEGGGRVFAASSIAWCSTLNTDGGRNPVSRLTQNVLEEFLTR